MLIQYALLTLHRIFYCNGGSRPGEQNYRNIGGKKMLAEKLKKLLKEKCDKANLDYDKALLDIANISEQHGLSENGAVMQWMSNNSNALKRVNCDVTASFLFLDTEGREVKKGATDLKVYDSVLVVKYPEGDDTKIEILASSFWEGGDNPDGNKLLEEVLSMDREEKVYEMKNVGIDYTKKKLMWTKDTTFEESSDTVDDLLKEVPMVSAAFAVDNLDATLLYKGTVAKVATTGTGFGLEIGDIPEDLSVLPEPSMVWFDDEDTRSDELDRLVGKEVCYVARYYLPRKKEEITGNGYYVSLIQ